MRKLRAKRFFALESTSKIQQGQSLGGNYECVCTHMPKRLLDVILLMVQSSPRRPNPSNQDLLVELAMVPILQCAKWQI